MLPVVLAFQIHVQKILDVAAIFTLHTVLRVLPSLITKTKKFRLVLFTNIYDLVIGLVIKFLPYFENRQSTSQILSERWSWWGSAKNRSPQTEKTNTSKVFDLLQEGG